MDWKEILGSLKEDPALPPGEDPAEESAQAPAQPRREKLHVLIDRKGRKGKTATIVEGFECSDAEVARIAADLKRRIGSGGSSRGGEILLQGDCAAKARAILAEMGYKVV